MKGLLRGSTLWVTPAQMRHSNKEDSYLDVLEPFSNVAFFCVFQT